MFRPFPSLAARRFTPGLALWLPLALPLCGCELLRSAGMGPRADVSSAAGEESRAASLRPIPKPRDAFVVEVLFVERPAGDPLLGSELWSELAQPGELPATTRDLLEENGFRLGTCGSTAPRALQVLLARSVHEVLAVRSGESGDAPQTTLMSHRVALQSHGETELQTSPVYPACSIAIRSGGAARERRFEQARCLFRVTAERVQDGWVRLEFSPEVHHGELKTRHVAGNGGFVLKSTQEVAPFPVQRFAVTLNLGEMVVLSADPDRPDSLGRHFFIGAGEDEPLQRLIVIRLADMKRTDPIYSR
ncbi:MAG: hypothetical protein WD066_18580 [Planctomycetaceae bacterium]